MATRSRCAKKSTASGIPIPGATTTRPHAPWPSACCHSASSPAIGSRSPARIRREWFYADLGIQMIGAVAVGIYPTNPWVELQYIVRHSGARVVVTGDQEQTDKVLDALANNDGLPALEAIVCVDMKGLRQYRQSQLMSFESALPARQDLRYRKPRRQCDPRSPDFSGLARRRLASWSTPQVRPVRPRARC